MPQFESGVCGRCKDSIFFNRKLAYIESGNPVCPICVNRRINPLRKQMGKMPIPISKNAYEENNVYREL
tara:strand:- start:42 stop:248 length:207 start_codon:yes stop_codon:yes gene_type:complete